MQLRRTINFDDVKLSYVDRPGDGPVLVLIPGSFEDVHQWDATATSLPADWRLILIEVRGHGQSWPPLASDSIETFAEDVMRVANHADLHRFYVGGHSIGGMIAIEVARIAPKSVAAVISIEGWTHGLVTVDAFDGNMYGTLTPQLQETQSAARDRATGHWTDDQRDQFCQIYLRWERGLDCLQATSLPILELYGDRGKPKPTREQLQIPDRPNIQLQWFNDASHALPLERPRELADAIVPFIEALEPRR